MILTNNQGNIEDFFKMFRGAFISPKSIMIMHDHNLKAAETVLDGMKAAIKNQREELKAKPSDDNGNQSDTSFNPQAG